MLRTLLTQLPLTTACSSFSPALPMSWSLALPPPVRQPLIGMKHAGERVLRQMSSDLILTLPDRIMETDHETGGSSHSGFRHVQFACSEAKLKVLQRHLESAGQRTCEWCETLWACEKKKKKSCFFVVVDCCGCCCVVVLLWLLLFAMC